MTAPARLRAVPAGYALLPVDFRRRGMSGTEVISAAKAIWPDLPVIFMSATSPARLTAGGWSSPGW